MAEEQANIEHASLALSDTASAFLGASGFLSITTGTHGITLMPGEVYNLLTWLSDFHRDLVYQQASKAGEQP